MSIPDTIRVPFLYAEFDSTRAVQGPAILEYKGLLIGQILSTGSMWAEILAMFPATYTVGPYLVTSADQVAYMFGYGSQLHRMAIAWFANNKITPVYVIAQRDVDTAVKAEGTVAIVGTALEDGEFCLYVNGTRLAVAVTTGDTADDIGSALEALVSPYLETKAMPVTLSNASGTVTVGAKNLGSFGNDIDIRVNMNDGEVTPNGILVTITAMASGANDPDFSEAIALLGDTWYNIIVAANTAWADLTLIEAELEDRAGYLRQMEGVYCCSHRSTLSGLTSAYHSDYRNCKYVSVMSNGGITGVGSPTWSCEKAAAYGAQLALEGQADPARPFQRLELKGCLPPGRAERFSFSDRNTLLWNGVATDYCDAGGKVRIERAITNYRMNEADAFDTAYLDVNTILTLMYLRYDFRTRILTKYPRAKLADDTDVNFAPGQQIITPKIGRAEAINAFRDWQEKGLVENIEQFINDLECVRSSTDPNRLEWVLPPDLINQFRVGAGQIQFLLQG